ncbi:folic acid synthesis protein, partial [Aspergillus ochraceoroseus]
MRSGSMRGWHRCAARWNSAISGSRSRPASGYFFKLSERRFCGTWILSGRPISELPQSRTFDRRTVPKANTSNHRHEPLRPSAPIRTFSSTQTVPFKSIMNPINASSHTAFIALGSNVGERVEMIEQACLEMERANIRVRRTSSLFETAPMYYLDQNPFMNGVETSLEPLELLDTLQSIEIDLGRKKLIDKGPRSIDLDILLYDRQIFSHDRLNIPHKLMLERDFVLRPLCQLIPHEIAPFPGHSTTYLSHLKALPPPEPIPVATTHISKNFPPLCSTDPKRPTHIMAILNLTPDSFSDGGEHLTNDLSVLTDTVRDFIKAGATIIDIGGESTRPGSVPVGEDEELARVIPAIKHIRASIPEAAKIAISIDTYRARVAEEACAAGADIINDVSAGLLDPEMLPTMARTGKSVILMHMRGSPSTMTKLTEYPNGVIQDVSKELLDRLAAAEAAGIRRWRIISTQVSDIEGLEYFPWLMGPSRKRFIGHLTGVQKASERTWGTAATVTASIAGGADIIRVHDVKEMWQVARVADAIYRG